MVGRKTFVGVALTALVLFGSYQKAFPEVRYIVKSGDTLYGISKSFGVSIEALKESNHLKGNAIRPKQVLAIPTAGGEKRGQENRRGSHETEPYVVRKGDTLYTISKGAGSSIHEIKKMNQLHSTELEIGQIILLPNAEIKMEEDPEEVWNPEMATQEQFADGNGNDHEGSEALSKWNDHGERGLFVKVVKTFLGAPYRLGGSTLKGIDCSAFVKKVYEIFDVSLPRTAREQFCIGKKVERDQLEEGDLVFFRQRGNAAHVGIYVGHHQFVHASSSSKEIKIDNLETPYYSQRFLKGVRVKELELTTPLL